MSAPLLSATDLCFGYQERPLFERISFQIQPGEIVGILGPNGAGKTTLLNCLVGLLKPQRGEIFFADQKVTNLPLWRRARLGLAYLSQGTSLFPEMNVLDNVALGHRGGQSRQMAAQRLSAMGLESLAKTPAQELSGGQRRLVELARLFTSNAEFLVLDEPFAMLDPKVRQEIIRLLLLFKDQGRTILMTDHDVINTLQVVDRAMVLIDGKVCCEGNEAKILQDTFVRAHYLGGADVTEQKVIEE